MKSLGMVVALFVVGLWLLAACGPRVPPAPLVPEAAPAPTPVLSPEEAAWAKVVEAAKKEGKVTAYSFAVTGDTGRAVGKAFEEKYGIKFEVVGGVGAVLIERIRSEQAGKRFIADTIDTSTVLVALAKGEGLTDSIGELPVFREKDVYVGAVVQDAERHIIGVDTLTQGIYYNTTLVKPGEEPKSYREMLEPKWKGKFVIMDPSTVPLLPRMFAVMKANRILDDDYIIRLGKQEPRLAPTVRDGDGQLARGEVPVGFNGSATINPWIKEGAPVRPVDVAEGVVSAMSPSIALVKGSPHTNAARVFINWLLSKEGQTIYHQSRGSRSVRKDVPDFTPLGGLLKPTKIFHATIALELEAARLQREKIITRLLGLPY